MKFSLFLTLALFLALPLSAQEPNPKMLEAQIHQLQLAMKEQIKTNDIIFKNQRKTKCRLGQLENKAIPSPIINGVDGSIYQVVNNSLVMISPPKKQENAVKDIITTEAELAKKEAPIKTTKTELGLHDFQEKIENKKQESEKIEPFLDQTVVTNGFTF